MEDLKHFVLECPAYDHIRQQHAALFAPPEGAGPYSNVALQRFFAATNQAHVATALSKMHAYRMHLHGFLPNVDRGLIQPPNFFDT